MANLIDENSFTKVYSNSNKNLKMTETNLWQISLLLKVIIDIVNNDIIYNDEIILSIDEIYNNLFNLEEKKSNCYN